MAIFVSQVFQLPGRSYHGGKASKKSSSLTSSGRLCRPDRFIGNLCIAGIPVSWQILSWRKSFQYQISSRTSIGRLYRPDRFIGNLCIAGIPVSWQIQSWRKGLLSNSFVDELLHRYSGMDAVFSTRVTHVGKVFGERERKYLQKLMFQLTEELDNKVRCTLTLEVIRKYRYAYRKLCNLTPLKKRMKTRRSNYRN